jgi:hypothetical protein
VVGDGLGAGNVSRGAFFDRGVRPAFAASLAAPYLTWAGSLHSLLDSLVDEGEDADSAQFSFIGCYGSPQEARVRMAWLAERSASELRDLPRGRLHLVLLAGMVASYLSLPEAHAPRVCEATESVIASAGPPVGGALFVFRARRAFGSRLWRWRRGERAGKPVATAAPGGASNAAIGGAHRAPAKAMSLSVVAGPPVRARRAPGDSRKGGADAGAA